MKGRIPVEGEIPGHAIPRDWATYLCDEIQEFNRNKWFGLARVRCWRCHMMAGPDRTMRCFCSRADNRGCPLINARDDHYYWSFHG